MARTVVDVRRLDDSAARTTEIMCAKVVTKNQHDIRTRLMLRLNVMREERRNKRDKKLHAESLSEKPQQPRSRATLMCGGLIARLHRAVETKLSAEHCGAIVNRHSTRSTSRFMFIEVQHHD